MPRHPGRLAGTHRTMQEGNLFYLLFMQTQRKFASHFLERSRPDR